MSFFIGVAIAYVIGASAIDMVRERRMYIEESVVYANGSSLGVQQPVTVSTQLISKSTPVIRIVEPSPNISIRVRPTIRRRRRRRNKKDEEKTVTNKS